MRTSNHVALREFWPTDVWRDQHGHSNGRYPVGFAISSSPSSRFIGMHRYDFDFSEEELSALDAIQSLLVPALQFRSCLDAAASRLLNSTECDGVAADYCLFRREAEVLSPATLGWASTRIGRQLGISERTVRKHLGAVYNKAGLSGRARQPSHGGRLRPVLPRRNPASSDHAQVGTRSHVEIPRRPIFIQLAVPSLAKSRGVGRPGEFGVCSAGPAVLR